MGDMDNARLDRIEEKIDKLSEAMIALARAEERLMSIEANNSQQYERMNRFSQKLDDLENKVLESQRTTTTINRVVWIAVMAGVGAYIAESIKFIGA